MEKNLFILLYQLKKLKAKMTKIYHIELKSREPKDYYFGSKAGIFDVFSSKDIGINLQDLWNTNLEKEPYLYENSKCIIRLGNLHRKKTNRGKKL